MKARWDKRRLFLGVLALLAAIAVGSDMSAESRAVVAPSRGKAVAAAHAAPPGMRKANAAEPVLAELGEPLQRTLDDAPVDIFKGKSWYVPPPPPPPPKPAPPPKPTAPPMPYAFMGSYLGEDGRLVIFLTRGDRVITASPGDVLEGTYRVENITAGQLGLIYLPLNIRQTLHVGEVS